MLQDGTGWVAIRLSKVRLVALVSLSCCLAHGAVLSEPPPVLALPERETNAASGSAFAAQVWGLSFQDRESQIRREITAGNIPSFLRGLCPVTVTNVSAGRTNMATFFVMPDYLSVGSDRDFLRMPMRPETAQAIADSCGCMLPTAAMADAIWRGAALKLSPSPIAPGAAMTTMLVFSNHNFMVQAQRTQHAGEIGPGALMAGHKKDVVVCRKLTEMPGRVAIYGWHREDGTIIQPLYLGHTSKWVDYSHGVRLVHAKAVVNGKKMAIADALRDPELAPLFSDEGTVEQPRYAIP